MFKKSNTSRGAISGILLILGVVLLVVIIIVFVVIRINTARNANSGDGTNTDEPPKPVYETTVGETKFNIESVSNLGSFIRDTRYNQSLLTTEKFIEVIVGAQNKGKMNTASYAWDVGNIVDSEGRNFVSINQRAYFYLPQPDLCGAILKPEFDPVPCVRLYEVSKQSTGLKVQVIVTSPEKEGAYLDLNVR